MVQRGEMALNDPVAKYLPATVKVPQKDGKQITLLDLATHNVRAGADADELRSARTQQPVRGLFGTTTVPILSGYTLTRDPGSTVTNTQTLGRACWDLWFAARRDALRGARAEANLASAEDNSTNNHAQPEMKQLLAVGHHVVGLQSVENWDFGPPLAPAGAIRSTANDLLKFLAANWATRRPRV